MRNYNATAIVRIDGKLERNEAALKKLLEILVKEDCISTPMQQEVLSILKGDNAPAKE